MTTASPDSECMVARRPRMAFPKVLCPECGIQVSQRKLRNHYARIEEGKCPLSRNEAAAFHLEVNDKILGPGIVAHRRARKRYARANREYTTAVPETDAARLRLPGSFESAQR